MSIQAERERQVATWVNYGDFVAQWITIALIIQSLDLFARLFCWSAQFKYNLNEV